MVWIFYSLLFILACGFGFWMWRLSRARSVLFPLSADYSVVMRAPLPGTFVTWPWHRLGMTYCCALRLWSQICVTCRSCWFQDLVALSCCAGAGCLGSGEWRHTYEMDMEHFPNPTLSVVVAKCWFLVFVLRDKYEFSPSRNPDQDDHIFDCLLPSMAAVLAEEMHASFLFVGDLNGHHQEYLGSKTTNRHGVAAFDFATVSCCDQLVVGPTHEWGGTLLWNSWPCMGFCSSTHR